MLPFVQALLAGLASQTLVLAIDGSEVGRNCVTLMVSLIYQKRAIPLLWVVRTGSKGHFPADIHIELLTAVQKLCRLMPLSSCWVMVSLIALSCRAFSRT